ncbi:MAG TPA: hypothetical protein VEC37_05785, partial [Bacillota bacterium]|nr:hypothetical protein [Bacillota bacterium]
LLPTILFWKQKGMVGPDIRTGEALKVLRTGNNDLERGVDNEKVVINGGYCIIRQFGVDFF